MRAWRMDVRNERGAAIALVAVSLTALLGMAALAIDLGMLRKAHGDAQRVADAAALAGASAFQGAKPLDAVAPAIDRAREYIAKNYVGATAVDTSGASTTVTGTRSVTQMNEAVVVVIPDSEKVRVIVRRAGIGTFFSRVLSPALGTVSAKAAAVAANAGASKCLKPFALPDIWSDPGDDTDPANRLEDVGNNWNKPKENWRWEPGDGDHYRAYGNTSGSGDVTGWGSSFRNNSTAQGSTTKYWDDYGREIKLKVTSSHDVPSPSFFQAWSIPGTGKGAAAYRENIWTCNTTEIALDTEFEFDDTEGDDSKPGNMVGPTFQGMDSLINLDPNACWAETPDPNHAGYTRGEVRLKVGNSCTGDYPAWEGSARVITVPLFSPDQIQAGRTKLKFNNLGVFFIEEQKTRKDPVVARFLYFAKGTGSGPTAGSLIKKLRLVE